MNFDYGVLLHFKTSISLKRVRSRLINLLDQTEARICTQSGPMGKANEKLLAKSGVTIIGGYRSKWKYFDNYKWDGCYPLPFVYHISFNFHFSTFHIYLSYLYDVP